MRWPQVSAVVSAVVCALMGSVGVTAPAAVAASSPGARANAVLARMTLEEKLELMGSGAAGVPRLCIPPLRFVDGPNGIGEGSPGVTAFPNAENVGASWDPSLAYRYGVALGGEAAGKGDGRILRQRRQRVAINAQTDALEYEARRGRISAAAADRRTWWPYPADSEFFESL